MEIDKEALYQKPSIVQVHADNFIDYWARRTQKTISSRPTRYVPRLETISVCDYCSISPCKGSSFNTFHHFLPIKIYGTVIVHTTRPLNGIVSFCKEAEYHRNAQCCCEFTRHDMTLLQSPMLDILIEMIWTVCICDIHCSLLLGATSVHLRAKACL